MLIKKLGKIEKYETYIDTAFSRGTKQVEDRRVEVKGKDRIIKSKSLELERVRIVKKTLINSLNKIFEAFPSFDELHPFYLEIISIYYDIGKLRKSLAGIQWVRRKIEKLEDEYSKQIKHAKYVKDINPIRNAFFARVDSVMKQIRGDLSLLEEFRRFDKWLPSVKTSSFSVCISGFPNVGKSTLLSKISSAKPEIDSYAFTTRRLNLGYIKRDIGEIQLIDTPGTLARFNKMNDIEKLAYIAMKNLANCIVYVYDKMEEYPWKEQKKLAEQLEKFKVPILFYLSKTDLLSREQIEEVKREVDVIVDCEELVAKMGEVKDKY